MLCTHKTASSASLVLEICHQFNNSFLNQFSSIFGGNCITPFPSSGILAPALTFAKSDFVVSFRQFTSLVSLSGVAQKLTIEGEGEVCWSILDQHGSLCTLTVPALYVPKSSVQLLSISHLLQEYQAKPFK